MAVQMLDHMIERLASSSFRRRWLTVWVWVIILLGAWARHRRSREILLTADGCVVPTLMLRINYFAVSTWNAGPITAVQLVQPAPLGSAACRAIGCAHERNHA